MGSDKAASFLQVGQDKKKRDAAKDPLPEVSQVTSKSTEVFAALSSKVNSLEASLAEVQNEGTVNVKADKMEYEAKLEAQRNHNLALDKMNDDLTERIRVLKDSNQQLRSKAERLTKSGASLTADLN